MVIYKAKNLHNSLSDQALKTNLKLSIHLPALLKSGRISPSMHAKKINPRKSRWKIHENIRKQLMEKKIQHQLIYQRSHYFT